MRQIPDSARRIETRLWSASTRVPRNHRAARLKDDLAAGLSRYFTADLNENWLLPTDMGPLLRYRTTHEQDKKYQHQADRSRKGEDVKVGQ